MSGRKKNRRSRAQRAAANQQISTCEQRLLLSGTIPGLEIAAIDGTGNNLQNNNWGSAGSQLLRLTQVEYADGISELAGENRASAREISNAVVSQDSFETNDRYLTDLIWIWGQFIDHDIDLTEGGHLGEQANIEVPTGDPFFDPFGTGTQEIGFTRSDFDPLTGTSTSDPRQQINSISAFLDGSVVYGSDQERADALRTFSGGLLKTSAGDLLPFNEAGLANAGGTGSSLFLAGDVRANENIALTAMHTVWVREHNRIANQISADNPAFGDEEIYQQARAIVRAQLQAITYNEFLPALLGLGAIEPYAGYDSTVNPGIANVFSTAAYRLGHSLLSPELLRLNADGTVASEGNIALQNAFFRPGEISANGIDSILQGSAAQQAQELDNQIVDDVRNFLFGPPGSGGFDLASLNIQRGRDHGLADYNQTRVDYGLAPVTSFEQISSNPDVVAALESVYDSVDEIDVWIGALAEDHVTGASVGELMQVILADQFTRLRDGDRFWYQNVLNGELLQQVEQTTLADVIERNTNVEIEQENIFYDSSVLYFAVQQPGTADITIRVKNDQLEIFDQKSKHVLASQAIDSVEQVILVGRDRYKDIVRIDRSVTTADLPGGVVAWGGFNGHDQIIVEGSQSADQILIQRDQIDRNGQTILAGNFERTRVDGLNGNDFLSAAGAELGTQLEILGGSGHDHIIGSAGNDRLFGQSGNDRIWGRAGDDLIDGGSGNDRLYAEVGRDALRGGSGNDIIYADQRIDRINTGSGRDRVVHVQEMLKLLNNSLQQSTPVESNKSGRSSQQTAPPAPQKDQNRQQKSPELQMFVQNQFVIT